LIKKPLRPIDDLEEHSALDHFQLEVSGVLLPLRCFPQRIVCGKNAVTPSYIIVRPSLVNA
jgi:hypothetical protein